MFNSYLYYGHALQLEFNCMSYTRQDIQNIIARNKKRNTSKSPPAPFSPKTNKQANRAGSPKEMAVRYQQLCSKYQQLLEDVKDNNQRFQLQEMELQRIRQEKQRDNKQLFRLRSLLGFIKKQDKGLQINMDMQSTGSWSTGLQKSTTIDYHSHLDWSTPAKATEATKLIKKLSPNSKQMNKTVQSKNVFRSSYVNQKQAQSQVFELKRENIYSPKGSQKHIDGFYKLKQSRQVESRTNKLSNSPYSKLRFSRKIGNLQ